MEPMSLRLLIRKPTEDKSKVNPTAGRVDNTETRVLFNKPVYVRSSDSINLGFRS